ncbi:MAG: OmpA family protein [Campylobacterales bacterium]|nr:OmpA family protein [Campylobacterales bacterium]
MRLKVSMVASAILAVALNAGWNIPPSVADELEKSAAPSSSMTTASPIQKENATTGVAEVDAQQKGAAKKVEAAAAKKYKEEMIQKAEIAAAVRNAAEVEAAKKSSEIVQKDWEIANMAVGETSKSNKTQKFQFNKDINKSEYRLIVPIAVEEAPTVAEEEPTKPEQSHEEAPTAINKYSAMPEKKVENSNSSDGDGDGVLDLNDKCPATPKLFKVDSIGCPQTAILKVTFETNKYDIKENYSEDIKKFAQFLKENSGYNALISGHTDAIGSSESNMLLSQNRANSVMKALIQEGVNAGRLRAIGEGENRPVADNILKNGRAENRRIEVELKPTATK